MSPQRTSLLKYLTDLALMIKAGAIVPEPDLEPHIFLPANQYAQNQILKTVGHPTLLDLLGYLRDEAECVKPLREKIDCDLV